jgi:hypothetical protein
VTIDGKKYFFAVPGDQAKAAEPAKDADKEKGAEKK